MTEAPPDLTSPEGRAAYRRELNGIARRTRTLGVILALTGAGIGLTRFYMEPWPLWIRGLALALCLSGIVLLIIGVVRRTRYHLRRIAGR